MSSCKPVDNVSDIIKIRPVKVSKFNFWNKTRLFVLTLVLLYLTVIQINSLTFNFTVICMNDVVLENKNSSHWFENSAQKSFVFSSMAIGGLTGLAASVFLMQRFGVKTLLIICGVFSILGTLFFPLAVSFNYSSVLFCRFLQGLGVSLIFTTIGVVPISWAPKNESSTFLAVLSCAFQVSNVICMPISGILCESQFGWRSVYYVFGISTIILIILFSYFFTNDPSCHRSVSNRELSTIENEKKAKNKRDLVPFKAICTDICVLFVWLSNFGGNLGFMILVLYGPTYLREVLHFEVRGTGFASALPFFLSAALKTIAGQLSDRCDFLSEKTRFVICGLISRFGLTIGYFIMALTSNRTIAQISYTITIAVSGLNVMGTVKCLQLRCRQHCHFAVSAIALMSYIIQFGAPIMVGIFCADNTPEQWSRFFIYVAIIVVVTNAPFPFFTTAEPADYVKSDEEKSKKHLESNISSEL